jgi:hypothetical protein
VTTHKATPAGSLAEPDMTRGQVAATVSMVLGFSFSLGTASLVLPLLALAAGYDPAAVGLLAAVSAIAQFLFRLALPWLLGRYPDRDLVGVACLFIAGSYGLLLIDTSLLAFVTAQLMQGSARALFWTGSQTHVVRGANNTVSRLAQFQALSSVGMLAGPAIAGLAANQSLQLALGLGVVSGLAGGAASLLMRRLPPFDRRKRAGDLHVWRRPGVDVACWTSFAAAGWRSMLNSFVPVVLTEAGLGPSVVGGLLALSEFAAVLSASALIRFTPGRARALVEISALVSCAGLGLTSFVAGEPALVALLMAAGGAGSGILTTMGPAIANNAVAPSERGDAIAATGTFRAAAQLTTPAGVSAALAVVALPAALVIAAVALATPVVVTGVRARQPASQGA